MNIKKALVKQSPGFYGVIFAEIVLILRKFKT